MKAIDDLNQCQSPEEIRTLLDGFRVDTYLFMRTGETPYWTDLGYVKLGSVQYGVSQKVILYMLEYEILFDEAMNPKNFSLPLTIDVTHYGAAALERCNDSIALWLSIKENRIIDARFQGRGCTMCMASASLMTQAVIGLTVDSARLLSLHFNGMLHRDAWDMEIVPESLWVFEPIKVNPLKIECVMVPWNALREAIK